jgi:hypothetical protein
MRLAQFTVVLCCTIVSIVALGSVGGLGTVEVATMSLIMTGALAVSHIRPPRRRGGRASRPGGGRGEPGRRREPL